MTPTGVHHQGTNGVKFSFNQLVTVTGIPYNVATNATWLMGGNEPTMVQVINQPDGNVFVNVEWAAAVTTNITVGELTGGIISKAGGSVPAGVYIPL